MIAERQKKKVLRKGNKSTSDKERMLSVTRLVRSVIQ